MREEALAAVEHGARAYFAARRARVPGFVDEHFSLLGSLRLHRAALGWDIVRAPLNLTLAAPQLALQLGARAARKAGAARTARLLGRHILLRTAVVEQIDWLVHTELLELPYRQGTRHSEADALAAAILAQPVVQDVAAAALAEIGAHGADPSFRARLNRAMEEYGVTRAAAAEITTGLLNLGAGAIALNKLTPGAVSLGPALAALIAHQSAVGAFPLGAWMGGVWYALWPTVPSAGLLATTTGGLMLASTVFAAFAGVVADPIQRATGLHRARLLRMVGALEQQFFDPAAPGFAVHDHYVARLLDLFDLLGAAARLARGG